MDISQVRLTLAIIDADAALKGFAVDVHAATLHLDMDAARPILAALRASGGPARDALEALVAHVTPGIIDPDCRDALRNTTSRAVELLRGYAAGFQHADADRAT